MYKPMLQHAISALQGLTRHQLFIFRAYQTVVVKFIEAGIQPHQANKTRKMVLVIFKF